MNHFNAKKTRTRFTQQAHTRTIGICFHLTAIKIEEAHAQHPATVIDLAYQLPPWAVHDFIVNNNAFNLCGFLCTKVADGIKMRFIFVTQWQMQHQIELIGDTQSGQFFLNRAVARTIGGVGCWRFDIASQSVSQYQHRIHFHKGPAR